MGTLLPKFHTIYGANMFPEDLKHAAAELLDIAKREEARIVTAESCTGGLLAALLTDIPGSSAVFMGAAVTYSNEMKQRLLGVSAKDLREHGAVSEPVARAMAKGACEKLGVDASMAITGIAGPGGGTPDKPVGTVHLAAQWRDRQVHRLAVFPGNRQDVRLAACSAAIILLRELMRGEGVVKAG